jgi:pyridoxine 4-dehydrogenase
MNKTNDKTEEIGTLPAAASGTLSLGGELTVQRLGFGAMRITGEGVWGPPKDPATAIAVLCRAVELGVNFIDTANSYGPNVNEELIAEVPLASKGGAWYLDATAGTPSSSWHAAE